MEATLTYGEVERRANVLARYLVAERGVKVEDRVGILLPRGFLQVVAVLGVLKAGGAYVPLDDTYPLFRIASIGEDCGMKVCVSTCAGGLWRKAADYGAFAVEDVDLDAVGTDGGGARVEDRGMGTKNLCYVLYTSGSTGKPKGVEVEHNAVWGLSLIHI